MSCLKAFKIIISVFLVCALLTGCGTNQNLKDLVIVEGVAIDNSKQKVKLSVQTLNVGMSSGVEKPEGNMTVNSSSQGETIIDAISSMSNSMSKHMFFGQNKIIMFGREVCEKDFKDKVDYFLRSNDSRADVTVCMVDGEASKVLESSENDAHVPVENIVNLINTGEKTGKSIHLVTEDLLNAYSDKTTDEYLPVLSLDKKSKTARLSGVAIFSDDKLAKVLDEEETLGFMLITGRIEDCLIEFDNEKFGKIGVEIANEYSNKYVKIVDGRVKFCVDIKGKLLINEMEKGITNKINKQDMELIESQAEQEISRLCNKAFSVCQQNDSDSLRVGEYLAKASPKSYELLADEWEGYFKSVEFSTNINLSQKKISDNTQLD